MTAYLINGKEARDEDYAGAIESLPSDGQVSVEIGLPDRGLLLVTAIREGFLVMHERPDGSSWAAESAMTKEQVRSLIGSFLKDNDEWREGLRWDQVILPLRKGSRFLRPDRVVGRLASWCSWRCPLGALVLVIGAQWSSSSGWQAVFYTLTAALLVLLFTSYGLVMSLASLTCQRPDRWYEKVLAVCGIAGGAAFAALGWLGAWAVLRSTVLGK